MGIQWKHNGVPVASSADIPDRLHEFGKFEVRASYKKPVILESMGFSVDDIEEHRSRFPNTELRIEKDTGTAMPVMRSLGEKRAYLRENGWVDTHDYR